jgi:transcriptional regulator with XRE-family HTH domain
MNVNFDKILKSLMEKKNIKQLQLAEMLGVRQSQISNWLNQKSLPGYYSIKLLCEKLDVSADYLLEVGK